MPLVDDNTAAPQQQQQQEEDRREEELFVRRRRAAGGRRGNEEEEDLLSSGGDSRRAAASTKTRTTMRYLGRVRNKFAGWSPNTLVLVVVMLAWVVVPTVFIAHVTVSHRRRQQTSKSGTPAASAKSGNNKGGGGDGAATAKKQVRTGGPNATDYGSAEYGNSFKPHVLFVLMDDLGSRDLGMHGTGIRTPVADRMAKKGLYLSNYYVHPMCTPTRIAILTGRSPHSMGIYMAIPGHDNIGMATDEETVPQMLQRGGYNTHAFGKWHVGHSKWEYLPTFRGFQSFYGFYVSNQDHFTHTNKNKKVYDMRYDKEERCGARCSKIVDDRQKYNTHIFKRETIKRIKKHNADRDGPMFIYLAYSAVHVPIQVPKAYRDLYKSKGWDREKRAYAGMVTAADQSLGKIIEALKDANMWKDTLLIFSSDNGAPTKRGGSNGKLRGGKKDVWEGGVISDCIISGPARKKLRIKKGKSKRLFHAVDWLPTFADMAGVEPKGKPLHGVSQLESLRGGKAARAEIFLGFGVTNYKRVKGEQPKQRPHYVALRYKNWKFIHNYQSNRHQLFNLKNDPGEKRNIASGHSKTVKILWSKVQKYVKKQCKRPIQKDKTCKSRKDGRFDKTPWGKKAWRPWC